ncbi:TlpA disulfide reductase family protein [Tissierella sp. MB52-C2]|uniref:TlpA family protein disulfide reductase n=1 Tax=Tissierella sp. MB52-C2 TaxID=3070999 RepID=UPI00280AE8BC|nr:TlpA disulfide reductase family protein [Tissierella sp. MB52-C2]WMM25247.1 TlpA disulfide reductase family protein [Tissierella sp. MB52-C2]
MKRKILTILISGVLCISMVACDKSTRRFEDVGIGFSLPSKWRNKAQNIDAYATLPGENIEGQLIVSFILDETMEKARKLNEEASKIPETDKEKIKKAAAEIMDLTKEFKELWTVVSIDKSKEEGKIQKDLFSKYENKDLIGKEGNLEFYLLYNNKPDVSGLSEKSKKDYEEIYGGIKEFKSLIKTFEQVTEQERLSKHKKFEFKTKTLNGKEIDSSIFKDSKLTMVNIWATYCSPCIEEMPELQALYEEVKNENVNVIGVVSDTPDVDNEELAKKILSKKGVKFANIIPDEKIINNILQDISGVPTTFFVDSEGNIIGEFIVGSNSKEEFKKEIEDRLKNIE